MSTNIAYLAWVIQILWLFSDLRGRDSNKPRGQYLNRAQFQKKFPIFLAHSKNLTPMQVEFNNDPKKVCPNPVCLKFILNIYYLMKKIKKSDLSDFFF